MPRGEELALDEILSEIDWSTSIVRGKSRDEFAKDRAARYIVERSIEIISEASRRISSELKSAHPEIDWRSMADVGNFLRHEYHATSPAIVWSVVTENLPPLRRVIEEMKASLGT